MLSRKEQVIAEGKLATQLGDAPANARSELYGQVYDQIYRMHFATRPDILDFGATHALVRFLLARTRRNDVVVEIGCGTGLLAVEMARAGRTVIACDVSAVALEKASERARGVPNVTFELLSGFGLPVKSASLDFAYSVEVIEHLHEEDVPTHAREVARVLKPDGAYWIHTPHRRRRVTVQQRFGLGDEVQTDADVHLKEWTYTELSRVLRRCGFADIGLVWWIWQRRLGRVPVVPIRPVLGLERLPIELLRSPRWSGLAGVDQCSVLARTSTF